MWRRALRFHLGVHDTRQGLSFSAGAVALRTTARTLRRASSHSVSHHEETNTAPRSSIGCERASLSLFLAPERCPNVRREFLQATCVFQSRHRSSYEPRSVCATEQQERRNTALQRTGCAGR
jgi:hypothetical protein